MTTIFVFSILVIALSTPQCSAVRVDGYSIGVAKFRDGRVRFVKDLTWDYERAGKPTEVLRLVGRDEWSVYLCNKGKGYEMRVDFFTKKILVDEVNTHDITDGGVGLINGRNVGAMFYPFGQFIQLSRTGWVWKNRLDGSKTALKEIGRDEWSVYLQPKDEEGDVTLKLDYHRKNIFFQASDGESYSMFPVKRAKYSKVNFRLAC